MANIKGSLFIRRYGVFYKVITIKRTKDCYWILNCITLETKQKKVLKYKLSGMLEALELASKKMKHPQDIMLIDLDDNGAIKFMTKKQLQKL